MSCPVVTRDEDGNKHIEWVWPGGRFRIRQNGRGADTWLVAQRWEEENAQEPHYGEIPGRWMNWDNIKPPNALFSGPASEKMWESINGAQTLDDYRNALYTVCCQVQRLEDKLEKQKRGE